MATRKAAFIHCPQLEKFPYPSACPFNTNRAAKLRNILNSMGLLSGENRSEVAPQPADRIVLKKFHSARYLHVLKAAAEGKLDAEAIYMGIGSPDCPVFSQMYDYSVWACGATLKGAELILSGDADVAFNPSGGLHHAGPERASGFCYLNDVALGCMILTEAGKKVLYLDVDAHHGDGVANAFYDRSDVMTISFHQSGRTLFPGTGFEYEIGTGDGKGYCVNVPLPVGTYDQAYMKAFEAVALPFITAFKPDVIVFELGADGLADDPLTNLYLTNNVYADVINHLLTFNKPILATGGGGYNIDNTVRAWALAWSILAGADTADDMNLGIGELRDKTPVVNSQQRDMVTAAIQTTIQALKANLFPLHAL